jgi:hypothetical protein
MATWNDVRQLAMAMPETDEPSTGQWRVRKKLFAWERPLRKTDLVALDLDPNDPEPYGPVLGARVPDEGAKFALIADDPEVYFTTPHFNGYPAVLVRLERISVPELTELLVEGWLAQAPKRVATAYLADEKRAGPSPRQR